MHTSTHNVFYTYIKNKTAIYSTYVHATHSKSQIDVQSLSCSEYLQFLPHTYVSELEICQQYYYLH